LSLRPHAGRRSDIVQFDAVGEELARHFLKDRPGSVGVLNSEQYSEGNALSGEGRLSANDARHLQAPLCMGSHPITKLPLITFGRPPLQAVIDQGPFRGGKSRSAWQKALPNLFMELRRAVSPIDRLALAK
jgi:hypothetical protein